MFFSLSIVSCNKNPFLSVKTCKVEHDKQSSNLYQSQPPPKCWHIYCPLWDNLLNHIKPVYVGHLLLKRLHLTLFYTSVVAAQDRNLMMRTFAIFFVKRCLYCGKHKYNLKRFKGATLFQYWKTWCHSVLVIKETPAFFATFLFTCFQNIVSKCKCLRI